MKFKRLDHESMINGTSYHGVSIEATLSELYAELGEPDYEGPPDEKVQYEWLFQFENGDIFTLYCWKEYGWIKKKELINWHIGGENKAITKKAKIALTQKLF